MFKVLCFVFLYFQQNVENFDSFHNRFLEDEKFQISRITFPLKGYLIDGETAGISNNTSKTFNYTWNSKNWTPLKKMGKNYINDYKVTRINYKSKIVIRTISKDGGELYEEHYRLISNNWFLIYYKEIFM